MQHRRISRGGFALPTVLIASVVMLIILVVSVSSVAAVRVTLKTQYYEQLAKSAGEAGIAYAKACLAKNGNVPLWTDAKPLRPSTDCAGNTLLSPEVQLLVVAGGGGGGNNHAGGGGGGGVISEGSVDVSAQSYSVVVGGGGNGATTGGAAGARGGNSSALGFTAIGGGGGGGRVANNSVTQALTGGSGGGGAGTLDGSTGHAGYGAAGTLGQGNVGGNGTSDATAGNGGGGGGAGAVGGAASGTGATNGSSGAGGAGVLSLIRGTSYYYGGGGSGGRWSTGTIGVAGITGGGRGGNADSVAGTAGSANSGGGGGGGGGGAANGGNGGSGIVVIRYGNNGSINATGGNITYSGPYKIHSFTSVGTTAFNITSASVSSCPTDPRCSVVAYDNIRSSFSVAAPTLNEQGRAVAIPNSGYVELLRGSTGEVWRTYRQPSVQAAVVPDLCSGAASTGLGWSNAVRTATQDSIPNAPGAVTISLADNDLPAGKMFFRKDFVVTEPGTYDVGILSGSTFDSGDVYIDGVFEVNSTGSYATAPVDLTAGCHTITVQLSNQTVLSRRSDFTASIQRNNSAPILVTDTNWRVAAGASVHFSQADFYADPAIWDPVTAYGAGTAQASNASWQSAQNDIWTGFISPTSNGCPSLCPGTSSVYLRDSKDFFLSTNTEVLVSALCDDDCSVYLDGEMIIANSPWSSINQQTLTLTAGAHHVGIRLYNGNATGNPSGAAVSVIAKDTGTVLTRTDRSWVAANVAVPGVGADIFSYEASFVPSPNEIPQPVVADVLVVAGGGGGGSNAAGGGGGGGVRDLSNLQLSAGTYTVTVGAGGAGAATTSVRGTNGSNSVFGSYTSIGGGGGAARDGGLVASTGGSGGGGAGPTTAGRDIGAAGTAGQGYAGGNGTPADQGVASKGGGGGGASGAGVNATTTLAGNGGSGFISYITGSLQSFGGGGGGSHTAGNGFLGAATDGGTSGNSTTAAPANRGGGGGANNTNGGGSGVVIVRFKTGTMSVSATGTYTVTTPTIGGVPYTVYRFTGNGSFIVN